MEEGFPRHHRGIRCSQSTEKLPVRAVQLIAHVSRDETLNVGDFFGSGPPAYSAGFELDRWIKPGDVVECEIEGVGTLSNPIVRCTD